LANELREPSETDSIECHFQEFGMGTLICRAAGHGDKTTNKVTPAICFNCDAGRVHREVGCEAISPRLMFFPYSGGVLPRLLGLFCQIRRRDTALEECLGCELVPAETTKRVLSAARGLFQAEEFYSAYQDIEASRKALRDGNFENAVTRATSCLESVMRAIHERLSTELPSNKQLSDLWKSTRALLRFDEMVESQTLPMLLNALSGVMIHLGGMRNTLSDAHGKGSSRPDVSAGIAELALNVASTLGTIIIRRYRQLEGGQHG
jgi:hypothetical protein